MLLAIAVPFDGVPSGTIDGVNTIFTLPHQPLPSTLFLFQNGLFQRPGFDFTLLGNQITFLVAPPTGGILYAQGAH